MLTTAVSVAPFSTHAQAITYANGEVATSPVTLTEPVTPFEVVTGEQATQSGVISESMPGQGIEKIGAGTLIVTGVNTYSGNTMVSAGRLKIGASGALPNGSDLVVLSGAVLELGASTQTTITSLGGVAAGGVVTGSSNSILTLLANTDQTINGASFTGGTFFSKQGTGTLTIAGDMTHTGFIFVEGGRLVLTGTNTLSRPLQGSGTIRLGSSGASGNVEITGSGLTIEYADGITVSSALRSPSDVNHVKVNVASGSATQSGFMTGDFDKTGAGTLVIDGGRTGQVNALEGVVSLRSAGSLLAGRSAVAANGAAVQVQGSNSFYGVLTINGNGVTNDGALRSVLGQNYFYSAISLASDSRINSDSDRLNLVGGVTGTNTNLTLGGAGDMIVGGAISLGTGSLTKDGTGIVLLTGNNTYAGVTTINRGELYAVNGNAISDTGAVVLANAAGTRFGVSSNETIGSLSGGGSTGGFVNLDTNTTLTTGTSNADSTYAGSMTGPGGLTKVGTGTFTMVMGAGYSGITRINGGTLQIGDGGTTFGLNAGTTVINNATLAFNHSNALTVTNVISGTGGLTKRGTGTLTLTGANTYTGATRVEGGTLALGMGGSLNSASLITVMAGATFDFGALANPTIGSLGGTGGSLTGGSGNLTIQMASGSSETYSGTDPFGGFDSLVLAGTGTLNLTGDLNSNKAIAINNGTLSLSGTNTLTGGITVNGKLVLGSSGAAGGAGNSITTTGSVVSYADGVASATPITINSNTTQFEVVSGTATQSGNIGEAGGPRPFEKIGAGTLILSGTNSFTGTTTVTAGTLRVNGSIASSAGVTVANGATFGGNASVSNLAIQNGGVLSPGNSIGTTNVAGNLTLVPGATTVIEIEQAQSDRIIVAGSADIAGTLQLTALGGPYSFGTPYTFLTATGGVTGTFGSVTTAGSFGLGVTSNVSYGANSASVTLSAGSLTTVATNLSAGTPSNVLAVARGIDAAVASGADSSAFFQVYNQPTQATLAAAVNSLSGEVHATTSATSFRVSDQFLRLMLSPPGASEKAKVTAQDGTVIWSAAYGDAGRTNGDSAAGSSRQSASDWNLAFGIDTPLSNETTVGFAVSASKAQTSLDGALGSADADVVQVGVYGTSALDRISFGFAGSFTHLNVETSRGVPVLGTGQLEADYQANGWSGRIEGAYEAFNPTHGFALSPFAALQGHVADTPDFVETLNGGAAAQALSVNGGSNRFFRSELGVRMNLSDLGADTSGAIYASAAWAHYFVNDTSVSAALTGLAGSNFTVEGAELARDSALLGLGATVSLSPGMTLGAELNSEISARRASFGGSAKLKLSF